MAKNVKILGQIPLGQAQLYRELLLDAGVEATVVSGDPLGMGATVWVPADEVALAESVLSPAGEEQPKRPCPACGEMNPGSFGRCWSCGASLDGDGSDREQTPEPPLEPAPTSGSGPRWFALIIASIVILCALMWFAHHWLGGWSPQYR